MDVRFSTCGEDPEKNRKKNRRLHRFLFFLYHRNRTFWKPLPGRSSEENRGSNAFGFGRWLNKKQEKVVGEGRDPDLRRRPWKPSGGGGDLDGGSLRERENGWGWKSRRSTAACWSVSAKISECINMPRRQAEYNPSYIQISRTETTVARGDAKVQGRDGWSRRRKKNGYHWDSRLIVLKMLYLWWKRPDFEIFFFFSSPVDEGWFNATRPAVPLRSVLIVVMKMRKFGDEFVQMRFIFNIINSVDSRGFDYCTMLMVDGKEALIIEEHGVILNPFFERDFFFYLFFKFFSEIARNK